MPFSDYLRAQLERPGFSQEEEGSMLQKLKRQLLGESQAQIGATRESLSRRGMLSSGQMVGISTDISSSFGKRYGEGVTDIQLGSAKAKRERWQTIIPLLVQMELAEKEGRLRDKAGWMKLIGTALGTGAGVFLGGAKPWIFGGGENGDEGNG